MNKVQINKIILTFLMSIVLILAPGFTAYMIGRTFRNIFLLSVMSLLFGLLLIYIWICNKNIIRDGDKKFKWFTISFIYGIICVCIFPFFPVDGWFFLPLALALLISSNLPIAIFSYTYFLCICVFLNDTSIVVFTLYFLTGIFTQLMFINIEKDFKIGIPFFVSAIVYSVTLLGKVVFYSQGALDLDILLAPVINFFLSFTFMLAVLRVYCAKEIDKEKGQYIDINDQEFPLLAKYKNENPSVYYNAIHTAYFAEKIARIRNLDIDLAKNGGYYHKIIAIECNNEGKTLEEVCKQYKFPQKAIELLQEINYKSKNISMKETAIVYLTDAVISSLLYLIEKNPSMEIDYGQIAKGLIARKKESGVLNESELSFKDIEEVEKVFIGEKLYYDFLRRK